MRGLRSRSSICSISARFGSSGSGGRARNTSQADSAAHSLISVQGSITSSGASYQEMFKLIKNKIVKERKLVL